MCRRATGSAFVLDSRRQPALGWGGRPSEHRSSLIARRGFCGHCGTPLTLAYDSGDEVALHAGTLDRPEAFAPRITMAWKVASPGQIAARRCRRSTRARLGTRRNIDRRKWSVAKSVGKPARTGGLNNRYLPAGDNICAA
jgi:hypothetical protein